MFPAPAKQASIYTLCGPRRLSPPYLPCAATFQFGIKYSPMSIPTKIPFSRIQSSGRSRSFLSTPFQVPRTRLFLSAFFVFWVCHLSVQLEPYVYCCQPFVSDLICGGELSFVLDLPFRILSSRLDVRIRIQDRFSFIFLSLTFSSIARIEG